MARVNMGNTTWMVPYADNQFHHWIVDQVNGRVLAQVRQKLGTWIFTVDYGSNRLPYVSPPYFNVDSAKRAAEKYIAEVME